MRVIMVGVAGFGGFRRERMRETGLFEIVAAYDYSAEALVKCQAAKSGCSVTLEAIHQKA